MGQRLVKKQCAGCTNQIVSELQQNETMDWYVLVADSYCKDCIQENPIQELCVKEMIKIAKE